MLIQHPSSPILQLPIPKLPFSAFSRHSNLVVLPLHHHGQKARPKTTSLRFAIVKTRAQDLKTTQNSQGLTDREEDEYFDDEDDAVEDGFSTRGGFRGRDEEKDYDRDPEFAQILGTCLDDPEKARSKMEERLRRKRSKILHSKTGSGIPMKVTFNKFDFSNSYIWFEFYNTPLEKDVSVLCDTIRSWHIVGRLGGCNSMNMQLSQSPLDKRPSYDAIQGANVSPSTFYNVGDLEIQENLARIWVDIGTSEPLLLDVLINALTQISSDFVGIKQVVFGGKEFENWKENLTSEDAGMCPTTEEQLFSILETENGCG